MSSAASDSRRASSPDIADFLAEAIFAGEYEPGDFVPKELDLCERFGVSRSTVRSALQTLVAAGLLTRISGQGSRVRALQEWHLLDPRVSSWMARFAQPNPRIQREIFAFRVAVEPYVARLAAEHATAADLLAIESAHEGMIRALEHDDLHWQGISHNDYDVAFHEAIFAASHNLVWAQISHVLKPAIALLVEKSNHSADELNDSMERHRRVMEAIRLRQPQRAAKAALAVLERTGRDLGLEELIPSIPAIEVPSTVATTSDKEAS
ncbi:FadR/GntR family transcriptional regulator [Halomonas elongata]|uniref:FadR/GntR family transcriptional regulator n=2 Tax=Halomonas elongata TaxID=2746 RepID=E1V8N4_HALED|nr:FadR/GntR family transcriptional regulator [Halomonas elongata]MBW5802090.1 FadR family transcriptional regulator [Halomonas elongata]MDL4862804.1 FadR/GntR family transcriptional regulator [Halomonas elongata]OBX37488.1 pyruvate dehydrogenase complex repressor [Halomonas elongata]WPU47758.1 FadR/GntR family transcriptional regulator [Halomonas elongata DSM 2581]WVI72401.1 FadR/GntR family transcriptional regulator [Halomonas elongata]